MTTFSAKNSSESATAILSEIQVGRGVNDFRVKCDTELNTPDVIDRNEMRARIGVQPIRAAEFIFIEFSIHRTGSFGENADTFSEIKITGWFWVKPKPPS